MSKKNIVPSSELKTSDADSGEVRQSVTSDWLFKTKGAMQDKQQRGENEKRRNVVSLWMTDKENFHGALRSNILEGGKDVKKKSLICAFC